MAAPPSRLGRPSRWRRALFRATDVALAAPLSLLSRVLPALPEGAALAIADTLAMILYVCDRRGRRAGMQNLAAVFGDEMPVVERRRVLRASYRHVLTTLVLLFHVQPMTPKKWSKYVRVDPSDEPDYRARSVTEPQYVAGSPHLGNWELLLASGLALDYAPASDYVVESTGWPAVDAVFERLRVHGGGAAASRKGGAGSLRAALDQGRCASMLVDRNVPRRYGGVYIPFLGLPARTSPLPARIAWWHKVPLIAAIMIPEARLRWRLYLSNDLLPRTGDEDADVTVGMARMNDLFSRVIREHPEQWTWMLKRWKSRPTPELGPYPAYSLYEP